MRSPELVATQMRTFLFTGIADCTAMPQRLGVARQAAKIAAVAHGG
jgi:hypothetical protein